ESDPQTATVSNTGNVDVTISSVVLGGTDTDSFGHPTDDAGDCVAGMVLAPFDHCTARATFHPPTTGAKSASLTVHSDAADVTIALSGRGTQTAWSRDKASLSFGNQDIDDDATATQDVTVTNDGTEAI